MSLTSIAIRTLTKRYSDNLVALDRVSLDIPTGQFVAILGPSGCGKSTLLRIVAGLDHPTEGTVAADSMSVAYVFQDAHLLPWRTVLHNAALPLELQGVEKSLRLDAARAALDRVGLGDFVSQYPAQLSGGMRMRVSLARALVTNPDLLLLDEPFAALDEITRQRLDEQLRDLWIEKRMTVVFVTHSTAEAVFLADRAIVLSPRPGKVVLDAPIELGEQRRAALRGSPEFARQTLAVYQALETGAG